MAFPPIKKMPINNILITIMVIVLILVILWEIAIPTILYDFPSLQNITVVMGLGFVIASFVKLHQHKLNPTQKAVLIAISTVWLMLVIEIILSSVFMLEIGIGIAGIIFVLGALWKAHQHKPDVN